MYKTRWKPLAEPTKALARVNMRGPLAHPRCYLECCGFPTEPESLASCGVVNLRPADKRAYLYFQVSRETRGGIWKIGLNSKSSYAVTPSCQRSDEMASIPRAPSECVRKSRVVVFTRANQRLCAIRKAVGDTPPGSGVKDAQVGNFQCKFMEDTYSK